MYNVNVNGKSVVVKSYAAATASVKDAALARAHALLTPIRAGLYRSPKATARLNAERAASITKLATGIKFPKTAGDAAGKVAGLRFTIVRK